MCMELCSFALGFFEEFKMYIFISDCRNESLLCFGFVINIQLHMQEEHRLYTCQGNQSLCLNEGQCLCNLVPIWCLKVSFEINSIVWIGDKTVSIHEEKSPQSSNFLVGLKHCGTHTDKSTSLPLFIISAQLYIRKLQKPP